jgi:heme-degrading monooxygenase HmoA
MTTISTKYKILTLINVFTVTPAKQEELSQLLIDATKQTMKHLPGFISANIHKSFDGTKVVNYAQWNSREDFEAMTKNPEAIPHMRACTALASFEPILCEVADSISINSDDLA